jgi:hypothetical protein
MSVELVMLDQRIISLFQELPNHPKLYARLKEAEHQGAIAHATIFHLKQDENIPVIQNFEQGIGFLAAEVGILLHGDYSYEAICDICDKIRLRLEAKRTVVLGGATPRHVVESERPANLPKYLH